MSEIKYAVYQQKETVLQSWVKDIVTLLVMTFLISISIWGDSVFWTFVTGGIFLLIVIGKIKKMMGESRRFESKADLQDWVDSLEDNNSKSALL